jgi:hypothetical protein
MKLISPDKTYIYYIRDRADGKSHGIRIGQGIGACGFVSETPAAEQTHRVRFTHFDSPAAQVPIVDNAMPPILMNVIGELEDEHPEIHGLLSGAITFDQALRVDGVEPVL